MIITKLIIFSLTIHQIITIDQQCTPSTVCPFSSYCDTNQAYCICNTGYIGNCNTVAPLIGSTASNYSINTNQQLLFSINPQRLNVYIEYSINICTNVSSLPISVMLWAETGDITNYTQSNGLTSSNAFTASSTECLTLLTPFIKLGQQPNGQNQLIILGINDTSSTTNGLLVLSISQQIVQGFVIEYYLIIGISIFIVVLIILTLIYVICRRRRRRNERQANQKKESEYNDIQFFKDHMPLFNALQLAGQKQACPICLQQIESPEVVRRTPCNHIFHSNCIDSWCLKTLNCPVCREDLSLATFNQKTMRRNTQLSQKIQTNTYQIKWQQVQVQTTLDNKYIIRQSML